MKKAILTVTIITAFLLAMTGLTSWKQQKKDTVFLPQLSDYHIFKGPLHNLAPEAGFHPYHLATPLFTDYAEKQRLIRLPEGTKMTKIDQGLPDFPDGTLLVKTFYYYNDKRDTARGRRIMETRLMIRFIGKWLAATYAWNEAQTDATLQKGGSNSTVSWITATGETRTLSYHIPSPKECGTCHNNGDGLNPIGLKLRNLNIDHQIRSLQTAGLLNEFDPHQLPHTARAFDDSFTLADQARAYLDINCAHCHNPNGYARRTGLYFGYELPLESAGIQKKKDAILKKFQKGKMPLLGTTVVHGEALELLRDYLTSLH